MEDEGTHRNISLFSFSQGVLGQMCSKLLASVMAFTNLIANTTLN